MNGSIAQLVALTCHANAFIKNIDVGKFFPKNSTCKFCDYIKFVESNKTLFGINQKKQVANNPNEWFGYLKNKSANGVLIFRSPQNNSRFSDRMSAGFVGGGGTWVMEVVYPMSSEFWIARWDVWNQDAPEQRIWRVVYGLAKRGKTSQLNDNLIEKEQELIESLKEIKEFSEEQNCGGFTECFKKGLEALGRGVKKGYHQDLSPKGLLLEKAELMLDACQSAWVFGGMGSWNDMGFDGDAQKTYERVSDRLFNAVTESIVAGTNTSFKI